MVRDGIRTFLCLINIIILMFLFIYLFIFIYFKACSEAINHIIEIV